MPNGKSVQKTYWHDTPDLNFIKTNYAPTFKIDCCGCYGVSVLDPFFCYSSTSGLAITKALSAYQMRILHGPVCNDASEKELNSWVEYMLSVAKSVRATSVSVTPPYFDFVDNTELESAYDFVFNSMGFKATKKHTVLLDISQGKDTIFKNLKYETRRSVRRVAETDVKVVDLKKQDHIDQWRNLKGRTNAINTARINNIAALECPNYSYLVAELDGEALAWSGVKWGNEVGYIEGITTSPAARTSKTKRFANYALQWHIIEEAIKRGVKWFDYAGAEADSDDPKKINIMKFKLSWGGKLVSYNQYDKDINFTKSHLIKAIKSGNSYRKVLQDKINTKLKQYRHD